MAYTDLGRFTSSFGEKISAREPLEPSKNGAKSKTLKKRSL
jgi:hypothetical protein